jgi:hypothetical protein
MHEPLFYATVDKKDVAFYGDRKQYTVLEEELTPEISHEDSARKWRTGMKPEAALSGT